MLMEYLDFRGNTNGEINGLLRMGFEFKHKLMKLQVTESEVQNPWREENVLPYFMWREVDRTSSEKSVYPAH